MGGANIDVRKRGLAGYQGLFLALTLIVMIIIIITTRNLTTAVLVIGLITNFLIISSQMTLMKDRQITLNGRLSKIDKGLASSVAVNPSPGFVMGEGFSAGDPEGDSQPADDGQWVAVVRRLDDAQLADDALLADDAQLADDADSEDDLSDDDSDPDWPGACRDTDTYLPADGDERITYQVRSRNIPERVWAGTHQRKQQLAPYFGEELAEAEDQQWWGRGEF